MNKACFSFVWVLAFNPFACTDWAKEWPAFLTMWCKMTVHAWGQSLCNSTMLVLNKHQQNDAATSMATITASSGNTYVVDFCNVFICSVCACLWDMMLSKVSHVLSICRCVLSSCTVIIKAYWYQTVLVTVNSQWSDMLEKRPTLSRCGCWCQHWAWKQRQTNFPTHPAECWHQNKQTEEISRGIESTNSCQPSLRYMTGTAVVRTTEQKWKGTDRHAPFRWQTAQPWEGVGQTAFYKEICLTL